MMKGSRVLAFFVMLAMLVSMFVAAAPPQQLSAAGNTYYVDAASGNDATGNGSTGSPWKTITKAASIAAAGDTVKIRSGTYRESVKPANSGTAGNPITFEPDTGATVTVSGADLVTGSWTAHSGSIYKKAATLPMGDFLDQVFVDGVSNNLARSPNSDVTNLYDPAFYHYTTSSTRSVLNDPTNLNQANGYWDGAAVFVEDSGSWNISSALVTTSTTGNLNLKTSQNSYSLKLSTYDNTLRLISPNGSVLGTHNMTVSQNTTYNLKVTTSGSSIQVFVNSGGSPVISATDSSNLEGAFGLGLESSSGSTASTVEFTNVNATITNQNPNQATGRNAATFASNIKGWNKGEDTGWWTTDGTKLSGYTQPQTSGTTAWYESRTTAKDFTYSADVKLTSAGSAYMTFRKEKLPGYVIDLSDWGYGGSEYMIMGKLAALDYPGEWYYDKGAGQLYLRTTASDSPASHSVEYKARNLAFDLTGKSHIVVKGVKLFAATIDTTGGSNNVIDGINAKYVSYFNLGIEYSAGICLCGTNDTLKNSEIAYSSGALVTIAGDSNKLVNNLIHDGTYGPFVFNSAVDITGRWHLVSHNTVYNSGRSLIGGEFFAAVIQYNDFHHGNWFASDTAMLYTAHNDLGNSEIHHNYWHDFPQRSNGAGGWGGGVYLDESSANALIYNNVTWNLTWVGIIVNHLSNFVQVYNNTTHTTSGIRVSEPTYGLDAYGDRVINNIATEELSTGATSIGAVFSNNHTSTDPLYVNSGSYNFRLTSGSPAKDAGTSIRGITDGHTGSSPDIGAYEFNGANWSAGHNFSSPPNPTYHLVDTDFKNLIVNGSLDMNRMQHPNVNSLYGWTKTHSLTAQPAYDYTGGEIASRFKYKTGVSLGTGQDGIEQTITGLTPSTTYEIRGYLRANSSGQTVRLGVKNYGGSDTYQEHNATTWTAKTFTFTTGASSTSATIYAYKPTTGGYAWVDDVMVQATTTVPGGPTPTPTPTPTPPPQGTTTVNDHTIGTGNNQFEFVGSWGTNANGTAYQSDVTFSETTNDYYQVRFYGTQIELYSEKSNLMGIVGVSIDGGSETMVDTYAATQSGNQLVYTSPTLTAGQHTLKVRLTGTKNASSSAFWHVADRVDIINGSATPTPTPTITPTPTPTPTPSIYSENFESTSTGQMPTGWTTSTAGGSASVQVAADGAATGNKALILTQTSYGVADVIAAKTFTAATGTVTVHTRMKASQTNSLLSGPNLLDSSGTTLVQLAFRENGKIGYVNSSWQDTTFTYSANQWYDVDIVVNLSTDTFNLSINGSSVMTNVPLMAAASNVAKIQFSTNMWYPGTAHYDNITVN